MPFGSNTRRDLIDQVLYEMSLVAAGQAAAPEDIAQVDRAIEPAVARYQALEILGDFDFDNVPDEFLTPVAILIADTLLDQYGIPRGLEADPSSWNAKVVRSKNDMLVMRAMRPTYSVLQVNYF
jgi:hypothetical protein